MNFVPFKLCFAGLAKAVTCALTATTYTVTATGTGTMTGFVFTVDQANAHKTTAVPSGWTTSAVCWVSRKNGDC